MARMRPAPKATIQHAARLRASRARPARSSGAASVDDHDVGVGRDHRHARAARMPAGEALRARRGRRRVAPRGGRARTGTPRRGCPTWRMPPPQRLRVRRARRTVAPSPTRIEPDRARRAPCRSTSSRCPRRRAQSRDRHAARDARVPQPRAVEVHAHAARARVRRERAQRGRAARSRRRRGCACSRCRSARGARRDRPRRSGSRRPARPRAARRACPAPRARGSRCWPRCRPARRGRCATRSRAAPRRRARSARSRASWLPIVPLGTKSAASLPASAAQRRSSSITVGSSPNTSSPTTASAMARRMAGVGRVTVSLRRSTTGWRVHGGSARCRVREACRQARPPGAPRRAIARPTSTSPGRASGTILCTSPARYLTGA